MNRANRPRLSRISGSSYASKLLGRAGDGSTLTLDFTTGVLDPRLTFTRSTNATFINSSGLVQFADANMMRNSSWSDSNPVPTSWSGAGNTPTIPATGSRTFTVTTAATSYIAEGGASATGSQGLVYTAAVEVTAVSGSPTYNNTILATASPTGVSWYRNGTPANGTDPVQIGVISYVFTSGIGSFVRVGLGASGGSVTNQSITMTKPRLMPGNRVDAPYFPSASATDQYQAPRFDYDPSSIGTPRGLLIEGSASNLALYSQSFTGGIGWFFTGTGTKSTTNNYATAPDGTTTAARLQLGQNCALKQNAGATGVNHTVSIWVKSNTGSNQTIAFWTGTAAANRTATTSWTRIEAVVNNASAALFDLYNPNATDCDILIWGAQLETGSGASSYIPTGASQGTRNPDSCVMTGTNFSSWFAGATEGVLYTQFEKPRSQSGTIGHDHASVGSQYGSGTGFSVYTAYNNYYPTTLLWPTGGAIFPGGIASAIPAVTKQAAKWFGGNDATNYANGVQGTTSTGTGTLTPNMLCIGAHSASGTAATRDWLNACVRTVKFWPVALPDSQIIALTTP
jgi:hypothetical protein